MKLSISTAVRAKLSAKNPPVTEDNISQCFANRSGKFLIDSREDNLTNPFTRWFVSETDFGLRLKICFIPYQDRLEIKTAYVPNQDELYIQKARRTAMKDHKLESTTENWENGSLGQDESHVQVDGEDLDALINDSLNMKAISIRLEESLINDFKMIAKHHGLSYQPLMRQVLKRFADGETRRILREYIANGKDHKKAA